jgi:hypothetical protein
VALAPLGAASAATRHQAAWHASGKKGRTSLCRDLKAEQSGASNVGSSITTAISSGNLAKAKQQIINTINHGLKQSAPALHDLNGAPRNVQTAIRGLIKLDQDLIASIRKTTSLGSLELPFATLAKNAKLTTYVTTVTSYISAQCGSVLTTTTTATP